MNLFHASSLALLGLALAFRPLAGGLPYLETETAVVHILILAAAALAALVPAPAPAAPLAASGGAFPALPGAGRAFPAALFVAVLGVGLALERALSDGNGQLALDQARAWFMDLLLFLLVLHHARRPEGFRFLLGGLVGGLTLVSVYALFQTAFGHGYFLAYFAEHHEWADGAIGTDEASQSLFQSRVESARATGPFGYANALGGYVLLLAPVAVLALLRAGAPKTPKTPNAWSFIVGAALLALCYAGGLGALLAAKVAETVGFAFLLPARPGVAGRDAGRRLAASLGWIVTATTLSGFVALAAGYGWSRLVGRPGSFATVAQTVFALGWMAEMFLWRKGLFAFRRFATGFGLAVVLVGALFGGWVLAGLDTARFSDRSSAETAALAASLADLDDNPYTAFLPAAAAENPSARERLRIQAGHQFKTFWVRGGYWRAALGMAADHPFRGVGLDNFGQRYISYKDAAAWPVRRVHNLYLQWLADGGLLLLLPCLLVIALYFRHLLRTPDAAPAPAAVRPPERAGRPDRDGARDPALAPGTASLARWGYALGPVALLAVYVAYPNTYGLAWEYLRLELFGGMEGGSRWATTGSADAVLILAVFCLLALPAAWVLGFRAVWRATARLDDDDRKRWSLALGLGPLASLLHGFTDFVHATAAISTIFAAVAGLAWPPVPVVATATPASPTARPWDAPSEAETTAARRAARDHRLRLAVMLPLLGALFLFWLRPAYEAALAARQAEFAVMAATQISSISRKSEERRRALAVAENALLTLRRLRPLDPDTARQAGRIAFMQATEEGWNAMTSGEREQAYRDNPENMAARLARRAPESAKHRALAAFDAAIRNDPQYGPQYAEWARYAERLYPDNPERLRDILAQWETAARLYPTRPSYRLALALIRDRLGQREGAMTDARHALALDAQATDLAGFLAPGEHQQARLLASGRWSLSLPDDVLHPRGKTDFPEPSAHGPDAPVAGH